MENLDNNQKELIEEEEAFTSDAKNTIEAKNISQSKTKKIIGFILFALLNIAVIAWSAFTEYSDSTDAANLSQVEVKWWFLIPAVACIIAAVLIETGKYCLVMKKTCGYSNFKVCLSNVIFGRYYDNVTPSGVGGQPYQIYHMNKMGVPAAQSAVIPVVGFMTMQYGFIIVALFSSIFGGSLVKSDLIRIASYFGLVMYALFPTAILVATFFPTFSKKVLTWGASVLSKIRLVKDKEKTISKVEKTVDEYVVCVKALLKQKKLCVEVLLLGCLYQIAVCSIPFFIIYAFSGHVNYFVCFCTTIAIYAAITFIPTPGNAGAAEASFYVIFSQIAEGYIFWAMLTWRFITCYSYIGIGILLTIVPSLMLKKSKGKINAERNQELSSDSTSD